ncbi:MAG: hypothetical protein GC147_02510 [Porphyrobacter sp.]|nr:hypothetical protein [Porphyrobacter sp.]
MPLYFFDYINAYESLEDTEGRDLPDDVAARSAAIRDMRAMVAEDVKGGAIDLDQCIRVRVGTGSLLLEVRYEDAVTFTSSGQAPAPRESEPLAFGPPRSLP